MLLLGLVGSLACPFTPRDTPRPCTPGVDPGCSTPVPFLDPTSSAIVRDNIINALRKRGIDGPTIRPNYHDSLDSAFVYLPDPDALGRQPNCTPPFYANWNRDKEVQFMLNNLQGSTAPDSVELSVPTFTLDTQTATFERYRVEYVLRLRGRPIGNGRQNDCYGGTAFWDFLDVGGRSHWTLVRWEDLEPLPNTFACTGGTLRGTIGAFKNEAGCF